MELAGAGAACEQWCEGQAQGNVVAVAVPVAVPVAGVGHGGHAAEVVGNETRVLEAPQRA